MKYKVSYFAFAHHLNLIVKFCYPENGLETYENAAKLFFDARRQGMTIRSTTDCLIAQIAIEHKIPLLHDDRDFDSLSKISSLLIY